MESSLGQYREAEAGYKYLMMRYYMPADLLEPLLPKGYTRSTLHQLQLDNPPVFDGIYDLMTARGKLLGSSDANDTDRADYGYFLDRAHARAASLAESLGTAGSAPSTAPATAPAATGPSISPAGPEKPGS